ncbi:MAG: TetR family transcriptional regulator [Nakamurella sp.]
MARDTRDRILGALRVVLARGGSSAATLEAVAAEAAVSKGGLLYHFPTKQALYEGLVAQTRASVEAELGTLTHPEEVVRRYLEYVAPRDEHERGFILALINALQETRTGSEAVTDEPDLSDVFGQIFAAWEEPVRAAIGDPITAEIVLQVGNGWYLSAIAGLRHPPPEVLTGTIDRLVSVALAARTPSEGPG